MQRAHRWVRFINLVLLAPIPQNGEFYVAEHGRINLNFFSTPREMRAMYSVTLSLGSPFLVSLLL